MEKDYSSWNIDSSSWHFKIYEFAVAMWCKWTSRGVWRYENVNLCTYIRMIMLWLPLMLVTFSFILLSPIWIGVLVVKWYGVGPVLAGLWWLSKLLGSICLVISCVLAFFYLLDRSGDIASKSVRMHKKYLWIPIEKIPGDEEVIPAAKTRSFFEIFCQWFQDGHNMFCREIKVVTQNQGEKQ